MISLIFVVPMAQWVGQQGSEAVGMGLNPSFDLQLLTLLIGRKIVIPSSYAGKFSIPEFFRIPEGLTFEIFEYSDTKLSTENRNISPFIHKIFRYQKFLETQRSFSTKCFRTVRQTISTENRDTLPFLCMRFFDTRINFSETQNGSPTKFFWYCATKNFRQKIVISSFYACI